MNVIADSAPLAHAAGMRRVVVLAFPDFQLLDVTGPWEVFGRTTRWLREQGLRGGYTLELVAARRGSSTSSSGLSLGVGRTLGAVRGPIDTLLVAGGVGTERALGERALIAFVRRAARRARRTASVCTGAFLLAEAGLLDGRRATTHWRYCAALARRHPQISIDPDAIYVRDGDLWTSAGVTAGIDLTLALIEEDLGRAIALAVAQELVVFLKRPGGQSQFSQALAAQEAMRPALRELQAWIAGNLDADLSVAALAARAHLSERSFARAFRRETGQTPAAYVEALRIERARMLLEDGPESVEAVARATGFRSAEVLRRAFHRHLGVSPAAYRERFRLVA